MLYIVATPIGNMKDLTRRALETLSSVDYIFAEDTRVIKKILHSNNIAKTVYRYDEHSHERAIKNVLGFLNEGKTIAFVSDAGTPGISDPGSRLVRFVRENKPEAKIVPIPGASALTAIVSVAGIQSSSFLFLGFSPHKKGRETFFKKVAASDVPVVFYESPHRIQKTLESLAKECSGAHLVIGRELTKIHEDIFFGTPEKAMTYFVGEKSKGEFVIIRT